MAEVMQWVLCTYILLIVWITTFGRCVEREGGDHGWLFRRGSVWVGWHWSPQNNRLCINLFPLVTYWIMFPGGNRP